SLLNPDVPESQEERAAARRLGLEWINIPLPGDGSSTLEERDRIRDVILDPTRRPMLVHCSAGTNRTGLTIGMYRIHVDHWNYDQVLEEMMQFSFDNLPKHEDLRAALRNEIALRDENLAYQTARPESID